MSSGLPSSGRTAKAMKILLIEDNPADVVLLREMLSTQSRDCFEIINVQTLAAGLDAISKGVYDFILLDLALPDSVGMETLQAVIRKESHKPVVVLTGLDDETVGIQSLQEGAQDYLIKGQINSSTLIRSLRYAEERNRIEQELIRKNADLDATNEELIKAGEELRRSLDILTRREGELHESEERFRELFNSMSSGVAVYRAVDDGKDFVFVDFNRGAETIEKTAKKDVLGRRISDAFPGVSEYGLMDVFRRVWRTGKSEHHPASLYRDTHLASWRENFVYRLPSGEVVAIYNDITERRQAEGALQESEQKFRDIFNNTTDAINIHEIRDDGTPGRFTEVNDVACRLLGYAREEMLAKTPLDITTDYHNPPLEKILAEQQTTGNARFETEYRKKDGTVIPVEVYTHTVSIQGRKLMLGVVRDITERKMAEKALGQANKKLNLLSSITRHDILNQLLILKGYLELSRDALDSPETLSEFLGKEEDAARTIERQIVFTKEYQDLGVKAPVWQPVDECVKKAQASLPMRDIRVVMDCPDIEVFADPLLEKVFYNIIDNALRYGGPGMTTIRICSGESRGEGVISVEDDGVGIPGKDKKSGSTYSQLHRRRSERYQFCHVLRDG